MLGLFISAISDGLLFSFVAMGVFISYRIFKIPDMTTDGSFLTGGAVVAALLAHGINPFLAMGVAAAAGMLAGACTGLLHTRFRIDAIIAGIIVTSALYSLNLVVMGNPSIGTSSFTTLMSIAKDLTPGLLGADRILDMPASKITELAAALLTAFGVAFVLLAFFKTHRGMAMRAAGDNEKMITPLGVHVGAMMVLGLAIANGLIAIGGGLFVQASGFATSDMGVGQLVGGLASVLVGKEIMLRKSFVWGIIGAVIGSVIYQLVIALVLSLGDFNTWMRFVTALFLLGVLLIPEFWRKRKTTADAVASNAGGN